MYSATDFEGMAWRKALKKHIADNLVFIKDGSASRCNVFDIPSEGQAEAIYPYISFAETIGEIEEHNTKGTLMVDTVFKSGHSSYALRKDGTYTEKTSIIVVAQDRNEASSVLLGLSQIMNIDKKRHGLYLNLAELYYGRTARFESMSKGIVKDPQYTQLGLVSAVWNITVDVDSVVLVSLETNKPVYGLDLEVE